MDTGTLRKYAPGAFVALVAAGLWAGIVILWPDRTPVQELPQTRYLVLAALGGALGACVLLLLNLIRAKTPVDRRVWAALSKPLFGASLGSLVYLVVTGGLVLEAASMNPYGVVALAVLAGFYGEQALQKLREVAETLFDGAGGKG